MTLRGSSSFHEMFARTSSTTGANPYLGNAPNFMVKTICEEAKVKMPSFFGYMAYSCGILVPSFLLITIIYFW